MSNVTNDYKPGRVAANFSRYASISPLPFQGSPPFFHDSHALNHVSFPAKRATTPRKRYSAHEIFSNCRS